MTNDNVKRILALVLTGLGYISYVRPAMYEAFNPITFWQKLVMFFTIDILSIVITLVAAIMIVKVISNVVVKLSK